MDFTEPSILDEGIEGYDFSHPVLFDTEEEKRNSNIGDHNQNPGSNPVAIRRHGGKLRGTWKCSQEVSTNQN